LPALPQPQERKPVDYASGFVEGYEKGYEKGYQAALRNAEEMINKILKK